MRSAAAMNTWDEAPAFDDRGDRRSPSLTAEDNDVVDCVEEALSSARELRDHWRAIDSAQVYSSRFGLVRTFNDSDASFGFLDRATIGGRSVPIMGEFEDMPFDRPKVSEVEVYRGQLREFALRYLLRVSDFRQPTAYVDGLGPASGRRGGPLSWCPDGAARREGFGYSQWYYKLRRDGTIGRFPESRRFEIVDLREVGEVYEWIVLRVQIYNFTVRLQPFGGDGPRVQIPLEESSYLVLSRDFIVDETGPVLEPDGRRSIGRYGYGYAFIKQARDVGLAYGPGRFDAAFQQIHLRVMEHGEVRARLAFVANRPVQIAEVPIIPLDWPVRLTNVLTFGLAAPFLNPLSDALGRLSARLGRFDPVLAYVDLADLVTGRQARDRLCISREQLERTFLVQHFMQHYQMMTGALLTWRGVADWTDERSLPHWVRTGVSS